MRTEPNDEYKELLKKAGNLTPEKLRAMEDIIREQREAFRDFLEPTLKRRIVGACTLGGSTLADKPAHVGRYVLDHPETKARIIISGELHGNGLRWIHLSFSYPDRLPSWDDLKKIKTRFLGDDRLAIQVFPKKDEWINVHSFCLHLWHCLDGDPVPDFRRTIGDVISI